MAFAPRLRAVARPSKSVSISVPIALLCFFALLGSVRHGRIRLLGQLWPNGRRCLPVTPPEYRSEIGRVLEERGYKTGAELGVKQGQFSVEILRSWPSCSRYVLVDVWKHQKNYKDTANVDDAEHEKFYQETMLVLSSWKEKLDVKRTWTSEAVKEIEDESLDFIYVDARHDFCGVYEDASLYWPKLSPGGIMAGHDYISWQELNELEAPDWGLCANGTFLEASVKEAVDQFASEHGLQVIATLEEWPSWIVHKPLPQC
ncbi:unnamed protein product [Darwinula stevensoni]|uniref:Uncharacterized protein n=1 Tax=Darwinula stevensoni TaxID=69355 RepID=A0A7R9A524_9CRUS|nr:unnamed protein product [Darwinula stevensoni]CAG0893544.1 unnamed protein product [Darwinula stevensoni]